MTTLRLGGDPEIRRAEVPGCDMVLLMKRPSALDYFSEYASPNVADQWKSRIRATVVGWENVVSEKGEPVPFSEESLYVAFQQIPGLCDFACERAWSLYRERIDPKKFETRSNGSSDPANAENQG